MIKQINFEDNAFVLHLRLRMVRDILLLDADGDLFLDKIVGDLEFIGETLEALSQILEKTTSLFDRKGQFENLSALEWEFFRILGEFLNGGASLSVSKYPRIRGKILILRDRSENRQRLFEQNAVPEEHKSSEPVVSGAELSELLRDL
jgi:hypothetical protein